MKIKIIALLLMLVSAEICFAQHIKRNIDFGYSKKVKKAHYINEFNEHIYRTFDKKGRLIKIYSNDHDGEHMHVTGDTIYSSIEYMYTNDKLIKILNYDNDTLIGSTEFNYDNGGLMLEIGTFNEKLNIVRNCYEGGRLQLREKFLYDDKKVNYYYTKYTYDDALNLQIAKEYDEFDNAYNDFTKIFTCKRLKIKESWSNRYGGKLIEKENFTYDRKGNTIKYTYQSDVDESTDLFFFKNGVINHSEFYSKGKLQFEKFYDFNGNIIEEKRYDGNEGKVYKNTYNKQGDLILIEWFEYGRNWKNVITYDYW